MDNKVFLLLLSVLLYVSLSYCLSFCLSQVFHFQFAWCLALDETPGLSICLSVCLSYLSVLETVLRHCNELFCLFKLKCYGQLTLSLVHVWAPPSHSILNLFCLPTRLSVCLSVCLIVCLSVSVKIVYSLTKFPHWLAQLVERQSALREVEGSRVEGSSPRPDQQSGS